MSIKKKPANSLFLIFITFLFLLPSTASAFWKCGRKKSTPTQDSPTAIPLPSPRKEIQPTPQFSQEQRNSLNKILLLSAHYGAPEIATEVIKLGADVHVQDTQNHTPIYIATARTVEVFQELSTNSEKFHADAINNFTAVDQILRNHGAHLGGKTAWTEFKDKEPFKSGLATCKARRATEEEKK